MPSLVLLLFRSCLLINRHVYFYHPVHLSLRRTNETMHFLLFYQEKQPQRPWPKDRIWSFKNSPKIFGSPMLDAVLHKSSLDKEMLHWLKNRPAIFQAMWDR